MTLTDSLEHAEAEYYALRIRIYENLKELVNECHPDENIAPGLIHWGHVGDANRQLDLIIQLRDMMKGTQQ